MSNAPVPDPAATPAAPPSPVIAPSATPAAAPREDAWAPLAEPIFRMLWIASLVANVSMWMSEVAAAWLMTTLTTSPLLVALVQAASTAPLMLFGLPFGALADILDRRRFFIFTQVWVTIVATLICVVILLDAITPAVLLLLTFANGLGMAMRWPVFAAIVPELLPRQQLPAALALNGISVNASRILGPVVAGVIIATLGSVYVFALNALLSLFSALLIMRWRRAHTPSALPGERFIGAMRVGLQHVRQSPRILAVMLHVSLFFMQSTAMLALLPLVARDLGDLGAVAYSVLLASLGGGAVLIASVLPAIRARFGSDQLVRGGTVLHSGAMAVMAIAPNLYVAIPAAAVAGAAWLAAANTLTLSAQLALPNWVRARGMSIFLMAMMGGGAFGAAFWGRVASTFDVHVALIGGAVTGIALLAVTHRLRLDHARPVDLTPMRWPEPELVSPVSPSAGPVLVLIEYRIDPADRHAFLDVMSATRRARLRQGALSWELFHDTADPGRYVEYMMDESWVEHLRRFERITAADTALRNRRLALHRGDLPPRVSRYVASRIDPRHP